MSTTGKTFFEAQRVFSVGIIYLCIFLILVFSLFSGICHSKMKKKFKEKEYFYFECKHFCDKNDFPNYDFRNSDIMKRGFYSLDCLNFNPILKK